MEQTEETGTVRLRWAQGEREFAPGASIRIGRDPSCEVVLENPNVSRVHARLVQEGGAWVLSDEGSSQGTFHDGARISNVTIREPSDVVFGRPGSGEAVRIEVDDQPSAPPPPTQMPADVVESTVTVDDAQRPGGALRAEALDGATVVTGQDLNVECAGRSYTFTPGPDYTIGRDADCDIVSANPTVSRRHAQLSHVGGSWRLQDADSSGGTYLDGERRTRVDISGPMAVWLGDPDSGERVVFVAQGERRARKKTGSSRGFAAVAVLALIALAVAVVAVVLLRDGSGAPNNDELARASVGVLLPDGGGGSGTVIDSDQGLILTNAHVAAPRALGAAIDPPTSESELAENPDEVLITVAPGLDRAAEPKYRGEVVAEDGYLDLAVVKITKTASGALLEQGDLDDLDALDLGDSDDVATGEEIQVVGYPSISESAAPNLTKGVVSSTVQDNRLSSNRAWFNVDADINPGNSGGSAVDDGGRLVGVPSAANINQRTASKAGLVRPINFALPLIDAARSGATYTSPFVTPPTGDEDVSSFLGVTPSDDAGFSLNCDRGTRSPSTGAAFLAVAFDYSDFTTGQHQDVRVEVLDPARDLVGEAATTEQYPFAFESDGCAVVTVGLEEPLGPGEYRMQFFVGPNYRLAATASVTLS